ncbi:AMP-binding protein [Micromonospora sp. R77]|uniref:class I adenylate-forming enzyme family protein n=1 Tax=Micromonospora sp. R77 TaxID=2925836 RepID=UPI001F622198|nr:fatty acid--CoA ligase family protein [Micromonospora sp. R77]MCI4066794.1 AMP-binding protein [Micromonospora sp. R77]
MQLTQALQRRALERPSRIAHRVAGGCALSYGEWWQRAEALAADLSDTLSPGARVGLAFARPEAADAAVALLAVWLVDAVPVLLPADRSAHSVVSEGLGLVGALGGSGWAWRRSVDRTPDPYVGPDEHRDAAIVLTSGTEGMPKAVAIPLSDLFRDLPERWSDQVMVNLSPLYTGDALGNLTAPLLDGRQVVTLNGVTGESFWNAVEEYRPTYLKLVPSMVRLLDGSGTPEAAASVTRIGLGSAAIGVPEIAKLRAIFPKAQIHADYSSTESGRAALICRVDDYESTGWAGELGPACFGSEVRLVDEDGSVIEQPGRPGEIHLRPAGGRTRRLIALPGQAPRRSAGVWVPMGDIGEYDDQGRLWFRCRSSEVVNVGGEKVSLPDIEAALREIPGVGEAATAAVAHPVLGSAVAALIVPTAGTDTGRIRDEVARRFRGADRPCRVGFTERIPLNGTGKVSRSDVARLVTDSPQPVAPVTEDAFLATVRASLGADLSLTDSVDDSGASSLNIILLCVDLEWKFGVLLDTFDVLSAPSFADLLDVARERQAETAPV